MADGDENAFRQMFKTIYNRLGEFIMRITKSELLTTGNRAGCIFENMNQPQFAG